MKGIVQSITKIFDGKSLELIVPVYQRNYDWTQKQCERLFDDLVDVARSEREKHFFGAIVGHAETSEGSAEGLGDSLFSCRCCGGCVHHGFEFDRSQTSQACLSAPTMIGPFDPGHDRTAQLVTSGPALTIENVVL